MNDDATDIDLSPRTPVDAAARVRRKRNWLPLLVLGLVVIAGGVIVTQFLTQAVDYYCNVDEVGVRDGCDADRRLRLQGVVERGTVESIGADTAFDISFNGERISVYYDGEPGGIFKECIPVIVHGSFDSASDTFRSDRLEVKHSDEYVSVNDERLEQADALADECDTGTA